MAKTRRDVVIAAFRYATGQIEDEPEAVDFELVGDEYDALLAELPDVEGIPVTWATDEVPDNVHNPLARVTAARIAPTFGRVFDGSSGLVRLRAVLLPDDRVPGEPVGADYF